jgi:DHA1 family bicyclomycin/chloramphenicol resistance-like MFS transporter
LNRICLKKWSLQQICLVANIGQVIVGIIMVITLWTNVISLPVILGLTFGYLMFQGFIFPNASAMAMAPFRISAGSASALLGFIQMGLGAVSSGLVSLFHNNTPKPMLLAMCICALLSLILHFTKRNLQEKKNEALL